MKVKQIAKQAGVSPATVYRVIANSPGISSETVGRVQEVMRDMGILSPRAVYQRSPRRKASTGITSGQIAFVLVGSGPDASLALIRGLEASLNPQNVRLTFAQVPHPDDLVTLAEERKLDGMVLHGWLYPPPTPGRDAQLRRLPLVWVMTHQEDWGDCVQPDNALLGRAAADKLVAAGVRELAAVVPEPGHLAFESRALAFCRVATERAMPSHVLRWEGNGRRGLPEPLREVLPDLIGRFRPVSGGPIGLLVPEDTYVGAVYNLLAARKLQVGRDVLVAVCGTHPDQVVGLTPPPARVDIDLEEVGRQTAALLLWRLAHRDSPTRMITLVKPRV